nr:reverse transcriptase domain-containing protein [Tanacetum cinerariifolium]
MEEGGLLTNEIKNMMANLLQINIDFTSRSGSLPSNTVANPKGELKAITTRSGLVTDGPTVPTPPKSSTPEVDERVKETFTDLDLAEYTIKQLHINITLADALVLIPKYQKMLKALLSNKEKLQELANTPLNENFSVIILKKLPKKLGDPGKFLISCGFSELKCKALADLGASINLMPPSIWKEFGLPKLIPTRITLELANRAICTPAGIARDVFVLVGKFTFPADFVIVDYESDHRVPLIMGRPFLRTARALIDVHGEEMILRDGDERLTLNMRHDTSSYSNQPQKESINLINIFNVSSEDFLEVRFSNQPSGNLTFSPHQELTLLEVTNDIFDSKGCNFIDELALITYPLDYDDNLQFDIEFDLREIEFLLYQDKDSSLKDSIDQKGLANLDAIFVDPIPEMFTDEHTLDYSSPRIFDVYDDDFLEVESDAKNVYDDPFDSNGEKIKESKLLIDELDLPCDFFLHLNMTRLSLRIFPGLMFCPQPTTRTRYLTQAASNIIKNHTLRFNIAASSVPWIYMAQFWHTLKEDGLNYRLKFMLDKKELSLTLDDFRITFYLPQATDNNHHSFVPPPSFDDMIPFYKNHLGFTMELKTRSSFKTTGLLQPWQTLCKIFSKCLTTRVTGWDQPPLQIMQMLYCFINNIRVDYAELLWEGIYYSLLHSTSSIPYPRFTKIIIGHYMTNFPEISRRARDKYHNLKDDDLMKNILNLGRYKYKVGIKYPYWMISKEMKQTEHYRIYAEVFGIDVPLIHSPLTESTQGTHRKPSAPRSPTLKVYASASTRSTVIRLRLPQRKSIRLTPPAPVLTVDKVDKLILQDTLQHVVDDSSIPRNDEHNILGTRLEPKSDKESSKVGITDVIILVNVCDEEEEDDEITDEVYELKRMEKWKNVEESRITPFHTPIGSPRIHTDLVSSDTEKL